MNNESITLSYDEAMSLVAFCNNIDPDNPDAWHTFEENNTLTIDREGRQDPATGLRFRIVT